MKMNKHSNDTRIILYAMFLSLIFIGCSTGTKTKITIDGARWLINGKVINEDSPAEGLLMNVRMVNVVFEDESGKIQEIDPGFDPEENTNRFISQLPAYVGQGVNAFTLSLQGGMPGYEGAINSAFNADGSLRQPYMERVDRVIKAADKHGAAIILSCFYQRQHSHERALKGKEAIINALTNVVQWIKDQKYANVVLEVSNEYAHGGYRNWVDGEWIRSNEGQAELIRHAKKIFPELIVSTSGMGSGTTGEILAEASDFLIIHFNNTPLANIPEKINQLKKYNKPIICNEDDKLGHTGAQAALLSVKNGAGWGLMQNKKNQAAPFEFDGANDDPEIYQMFSNLTKPGKIDDLAAPEQLSVIVGQPKDGDIFETGKAIEMEAFPTGIDKFAGAEVYFIIERKTIGKATSAPWKISWENPPVGLYKVIAVVRDADNQEIVRSREVDFEVRGGKEL